MRIRRTLFVVLFAIALTLPPVSVQALPAEGFERTYYVWDPGCQTYVAVGQEYMYCGMVRSQSWGQTSFGINDCGAIQDEIIFDCGEGTITYYPWWWTGLVWSNTAVCHA